MESMGYFAIQEDSDWEMAELVAHLDKGCIGMFNTLGMKRTL